MLLFHSHVLDSSQVGEARRETKKFALRLGFSESQAEKLVLIASEAVSNLEKHTKGQGGEFLLCKSDLPTGLALDIYAIDKGPGIPNLSASFVDGFSSAGTAGIGLGGMRRLASEFDIFSVPNKGTVVFARVFLDPHPAANRDWLIGAINVPVKGETLSGDGWAVQKSLGCLDIMMSDGLGHGPAAHEASNEAEKSFTEKAPEDSLSTVMENMSRALHKTRGAAVGMCRLSETGTQARFVGIGNIAGCIIQSESTRSMVSLSGIVGHECRWVQEFAYDLPRSAFLLLHSDGIQSRWDLSGYPGIMNRHPGLLAGLIFRDFARGRDDASVLVVKRVKP